MSVIINKITLISAKRALLGHDCPFFVKQELFFDSCWEILSLSRFFFALERNYIFFKIRPLIFLYENNNVMWPFHFIDLKIYRWVSSLQYVHSLGKEISQIVVLSFLIIWICWFKHFRNIRILLELTYVIRMSILKCIINNIYYTQCGTYILNSVYEIILVIRSVNFFVIL